jgi:rod shape-determining protein MreD
MRNRLGIYLTLLLSVAAQFFALKYLKLFPDLALITAVFAGIFMGPFEGVAVALIAGFARGCFSVGTVGVDMLTFPLVAYVSSLFSGMFYRRNLLFDMAAVLTAAIFIFSIQAVYISLFFGVDVSVASVLSESRAQIFFTVLAVPFVFPFWCAFLMVEE